MSEAKHKCRSTSGVLKETRNKYFQNEQDHNHAEDNVVLWDNAHYTQNDNYALDSWCFEEEGGDSQTVAFDGKVEYPWSEAKTKHVPELAALNQR